MDKVRSNGRSKKLIIMIIIVMLFNFAMPNYSQAISAGGGTVFKYLVPVMCMIPDTIMNKLQQIFIGDEAEIAVKNPKGGVTNYIFLYAPATIFSGKIAGLDVNFISPMGNEKGEVFTEWHYYEYQFVKEDVKIEELKSRYGLKDEKEIHISNSDVETYIFWFGKEIASLTWESPYYYIEGELRAFTVTENTLKEKYGDNYDEQTLLQKYILDWYVDGVIIDEIEWIKSNEEIMIKSRLGNRTSTNTITISKESDGYHFWSTNYGIDKDNPVTYWYHYSSTSHLPLLSYIVGGILIVGGIVGAFFTGGASLGAAKVGVCWIAGTGALDLTVQAFSEAISGGELYTMTEETKTAKNVSIAYTLRKSVANFYRALQEVALVILLCAIVYVAIRMVISTASKDKAKYKKMLWDCISAIFILFLLHFFISAVLAVIQSINDIFASAVVKDGKDILMSNLRTGIGGYEVGDDMSAQFFSVVIYITLVIYTVQFTVKYLVRVINMAFLTIIAPMVAFTYPIDKVKDGQSQALNTWIKEFSFNALMQPIHLILYWLFVGGAIGFVSRNPIYALVMIGFLNPAEKFVRYLFGLQEKSTLGNMGAALGGAAVMSGIKKLGSKMPKPKGGSQGGKGETGSSSGGSKVRIADKGKDSYASLRGGNNEGSGNGGGANPGASNGVGQGSGQNSNNAGGNNFSTNTSETNGTVNLKNSAKTAEGKWTRTKGAWNVAKKYAPRVGKGIVRGSARIAGAATLGTVGLAAGLATGDMSKAVAGLAGGAMAGNKLGGNLVDGGINLAKRGKGGWNNIKNTFNEGAYGKEEAGRMQFDNDFKKSEGYKKLIKEHPGQENTAKEFLEAGITDTNQMSTAMDGIAEGKFSQGEAIAYMKMANAKDCPDSVLYDEDKFKEYLEARNIPTENADRIREGIANFK